MRTTALIVLFSLMCVSITLAQGGSGQVCVRAYEDRNSNKQLDVGEPLLTRGVNVNLLNVESVIIASELLENSPTAAQGILCFQQLAAGTYSLAVTSADFTVTTLPTVPATVVEGGLPAVVEFGARQAAVPTPSASITSAVPALPQGARLVISTLGALAMAAIMVVIGLLLYAVIFAPRLSAARTGEARRSSSMRPVVPVQDSESRS